MRRREDNTGTARLEQEFNHSSNPPPPKKKYPSPITFRPTDDERERLKLDAGDMSQSAYIRECLFGARASKRVVPAADRVLLAQILAKLGETRMANNLNQIAYQANCGSLVLDDLTEEQINEAVVHIAWMRVQLIEALGLKNRTGKKNKNVGQKGERL